MERWYTADQAARRLRRNPVLVRRWLREGRLRGKRFGRWAWMVSESELRRFHDDEPQRRRRRKQSDP